MQISCHFFFLSWLSEGDFSFSFLPFIFLLFFPHFFFPQQNPKRCFKYTRGKSAYCPITNSFLAGYLPPQGWGIPGRSLCHPYSLPPSSPPSLDTAVFGVCVWGGISPDVGCTPGELGINVEKGTMCCLVGSELFPKPSPLCCHPGMAGFQPLGTKRKAFCEVLRAA